ncbi:hypothetical protein HY045_03185 [Candidatus Woesebacteria bacterium]|nr:hypothetical protein [Candidatus Woesebacteria bacterium]
MTAKKIKLQSIYLRKAEKRLGNEVWIVNGPKIRLVIYDEFLLGGNDQRYKFVPKNEIWVDGSAGSLEYEYTTMHEVYERDLMESKGMTYNKTHNLALKIEIEERKKNKIICEKHGKEVNLKNIYHFYWGTRDGRKIWIVDGAVVRRDLFPDFCYSGNDLAYKFIPRGEIWIDLNISCSEIEYQIVHQLTERKMLESGMKISDAYVKGTEAQTKLRVKDLKEVTEKEKNTPMVEFGTREKGIKI